jgi:GT2 family glycosyltransferase
MSIAIVVLTYNRLHLLRQCVENVLLRTSPKTREIMIWNNGSSDGTRAYLDALSNPRLRIVHHDRNIGQNAYALAFRDTDSDFLVEVDDDIIDAPQDWDATLLDAYERLPTIGFLAANLRDDEHDVNANILYRRDAHLYRVIEREGVKLKVGPVGGGCTMTSRDLYDRVGGFKQSKKHVFWLEDAAYIGDIQRLGYDAAFLETLKVLHAGGPYYSQIPPEKRAYWEHYYARRARRNAVKRVLLRIPLLAKLNARRGWFVPPAAR